MYLMLHIFYSLNFKMYTSVICNFSKLKLFGFVYLYLGIIKEKYYIYLYIQYIYGTVLEDQFGERKKISF